MVDLDERGGQLASILDSPGQSVEAGVDGAGGTAAVVEVDGAQADHRAEGALIREGGNLERDLGIRLELESVGARSFLKLIDHQLADEADAVVTKAPVARAIGSTGKGHFAEDEKIASAIEVLFDRRPSVFWKSGTIRKDEKLNRGSG